MNKSIKTILIIFALIFCTFSAFAARPITTQEDFQGALIESLTRMKETLRRKAYRVQDINQSLEKTIEAVNALADQNDLSKSEILLNEALQLLSNNVLAELILADVYEKQNNLQKANERYQKFLSKSAVMSSLTQDIMNWKTRLTLDRYARAKLQARGIETPEPKSLPLIARLETEQAAGLLQVISFGLPIAILFSTFFLIFGYAMSDGDIIKTRSFRMFAQFYFVLIVAYGLWLAHLLVQIPAFFRSEEQEVVGLVLLGSVGIAALEIQRTIQKRAEERSDPSMILCRKCKKMVEKLSAFCPYCKENF